MYKTAKNVNKHIQIRQTTISKSKSNCMGITKRHKRLWPIKRFKNHYSLIA